MYESESGTPKTSPFGSGSSVVDLFEAGRSGEILRAYRSSALCAASLRAGILAKQREIQLFEMHISVSMADQIAKGQNTERRKAIHQQFLYSQKTEDGEPYYGKLTREADALAEELGHVEVEARVAELALTLMGSA